MVSDGMPRVTVDTVIGKLQQKRRSMRCAELVGLLTKLGFEVQSHKGGHKTFDHPELKDFDGSDFNCGHSQHSYVIPVYVRKIQKILEEYEEELKVIGGEA